MNKKIIALLAVLVLAGSASMFAVGIGAQAGVVGASKDAALTFKLDSSPYLFAVNIGGLGGGATSVGLVADSWMANKTFAKPFAYFYGVGFGAGFASAGDNILVTVGPRLVGGLNVFLAKQFELYAQIAWQPSLIIATNNGIDFKIDHFPVNVGFRFWF
ncbi:MAG: hypothetical protein MJ178_01365 [Treponemataceae bacterium]|nr:hypothetical protein [Treponemataceae bacterium]